MPHWLGLLANLCSGDICGFGPLAGRGVPIHSLAEALGLAVMVHWVHTNICGSSLGGCWLNI